MSRLPLLVCSFIVCLLRCASIEQAADGGGRGVDAGSSARADGGELALDGGVPDAAPGRLGFAISEASVNEGSGVYVVSLTRTGAGSSAGMVSVTSACTSSAGYAPVVTPASPGTVTWAAGEASAKSFTIDATEVPGTSNGAVACVLSGPTGGASLGAIVAFTLTVVEVPDGPRVCTTTANSALDVRTTSRVTVVLSGGQSAAVTIRAPGDARTSGTLATVQTTSFSIPGAIEVNVSECPGDFATVLGPACSSANTGESSTTAFSTSAGAAWVCVIDPARTWFLNVRFPTCTGTCGVMLDLL